MKTFCDIIIPVYNALSQTKLCIESVLTNSTLDFRLIVINDKSDQLTTEYLRAIASKESRVVLLENEQNLGFLDSANRGLSYKLNDADCSAVKILLNSDTIAPAKWLEAFRDCFNSDNNIGVACPLSSNAENLTIKIAEGYDFATFAKLISDFKTPTYPDVTTAIGFCMAIKAEVLREVGLFDQIFAPGYGEDSDLHFKIVCSGYRSVLVDNCYVYHEADASFSSSKMSLIQKNRPIFDRRWETIYLNELQYHNEIAPLAQIQQHIASAAKPNDYDVLFVIPSAQLFGGIIVVFELVNRLNRLGLKANAIILEEPSKIEIPLTFSPFFYPPKRWISEAIPKAKLYVATHFETVSYCYKAWNSHPEAKLSYLIQGYEGWFPSARLNDVVATYKAIPNRITVSKWLAKMVSRWGCESKVISNGVDSSFFTPRDNYLQPSSTSNLRLLLLARRDAQGSWSFVTRLIEQLKSLSNIDIVAVGSASNEPSIKALVTEAHGSIDRRAMAKVIRSCDIFVDCSMIQGFGLIGLEAMSSGLACVLTNTGGVQEYATQDNSILCPIGDEAAIFNAIKKLSTDSTLLRSMKEAARTTAQALDWNEIANTYKLQLTEIINSAAHPSTDDILALNNFLFSQVNFQNLINQRLQLAEKYLVQELLVSNNPRSALEVLSQADLQEAATELKLSIAGQTLLRAYDAALEAIKGAGNRAELMRDCLVEGYLTQLPLLEKVISAAKELETKQ